MLSTDVSPPLKAASSATAGAEVKPWMMESHSKLAIKTSTEQTFFFTVLIFHFELLMNTVRVKKTFH